MSTKSELRGTYVAAGWEVQQVQNWLLVSEVEGKRLYDVNVVSPEDKWGTAQVVVVDDGGAGETATAAGFWADQPSTFDADIRSYARGLEGNAVGATTIFAITVTQVFAADEVALATAYMADGTHSSYVVKRRADTFTPQLLS